MQLLQKSQTLTDAPEGNKQMYYELKTFRI